MNSRFERTVRIGSLGLLEFLVLAESMESSHVFLPFMTQEIQKWLLGK